MTFRQQLHINDDQKLAGFLNLETKVEKYDVFVFELCDGNISKEDENGFAGSKLSRSDSISVCDQLLEGLIQLETSRSCHNDLKPQNILFNYEKNEMSIKISDFGQAGRTGGTPGWTWPKFSSERKPGKGDCHSIALMLLYTMCDNREVFYRIRNNYVENHGQKWLTDFRSDPFFKLIIDMMNLKLTPKEAKYRWDQISSQVQIITKECLRWKIGVDDRWLRVQDGMDFADINFAGLSLHDRYVQTLCTFFCSIKPLEFKERQHCRKQ